MTFISPAQIGDVITVQARLVRVGRTSMTIDIEVLAEGRMSENARQTSTGRFIFVALDAAGHPTPVPPLLGPRRGTTEPAPPHRCVSRLTDAWPGSWYNEGECGQRPAKEQRDRWQTKI